MIITNFTNLTFLGTLTSEPIFKIIFPLYIKKKKPLNYLEWVMIKHSNTAIDNHQQAGWIKWHWQIILFTNVEK